MTNFFCFRVGHRNGQTVYCMVTTDIARLRNTIELLYGRRLKLLKIARKKVNAASFRYPEQPPLIWLPRYPRTQREHGSLAHEAVHAAATLGNRSGHFEEEWLARTVGHIVYQILVRE